MSFPTKTIIVGVKCRICGTYSKHRNRVCHRCGGDVDKIHTLNPLYTSIEERFNQRWRVNGNGCWIWTGFVNPNGYPRLGHRYAHRLSHEMFVGPIPYGCDVHHTCSVKKCVNYDHLVSVGRSEHTEIDSKHGAFRNRHKTRCPSGHLYNGRNTYVDPTGSRHCRVCKSRAYRKWIASKKLLL